MKNIQINGKLDLDRSIAVMMKKDEDEHDRSIAAATMTSEYTNAESNLYAKQRYR